MAKINIILNNKTYQIDESSLADAIASLKSHLSTTMAGSGAIINLGGITYNIDSTKLSAATNDFVAHLGTIAGNGAKINIGGVEYAISSDKVADAFEAFEGALGELEAEDGTNELPYPIEYNHLTDNNGRFIKLSDYIPTLEEMENLFILKCENGNTFTLLSLDGYEEMNGALYAYFDGKTDYNTHVVEDLVSVSTVTSDVLELGITETGLYILNWNEADSSISTIFMTDAFPYFSDINEYGFFYDYEYFYCDNGQMNAVVFREDGSLDVYANGTLANTLPGGSAIYSNGSIEVPFAVGTGTVSSNGTVIDFGGLCFVIFR